MAFIVQDDSPMRIESGNDSDSRLHKPVSILFITPSNGVVSAVDSYE
jgi:hypothetical protein